MNSKMYPALFIRLSVLSYLCFTLFWSSMLQAAILPSIYERFAGMVVDNQGRLLASASVSVNGVSKLTDTRGFFEIYAARTSRYVINASKAGYASNSVIEAKAIGGNVALQIKLSPAYTVQFDPTKEVTLSDSPSGQGTQIKLPANALVNAQGQAAKNPVFVSMRTYDLATEQMPGDFSAINKNGVKVALETAGAFWAEFSDAAGVMKYNLRSGTQASISMPAVNSQSTVGLWSYDEKTGFWKEEGQATLVNGRFDGKVSHFSTWNFDWEKTTPSCVKVTIEKSLIDTYGSSSKVFVKAVAIPPPGGGDSRTIERYFDLGDNAIYNLPNDTTIQLFVPANAQTPYATVNSGGPWGDVGNPADPIDRTSECKGSITLAYPPPTATSVEGYACISGNGNGVGFSWMLQCPSPNGIVTTNNPNAVTPKGTYRDVATNLAIDLSSKSKSPFFSDNDTSMTGEACIPLGNCKLFIGKTGETTSGPMLEVTATGVQFNPFIRWISKWKKQTSINGRVWNDTNGNGLFDANETPVSGWRVFIRKPNGAELSKLTDANGFYEFTNLYNRGNHIIFGENRTTHTYTTPNSVTRNMNLLSIPRPVNFGVKPQAATKFTLSVSKVGTGSVASLPAGISCGADCTEDYVLNTNVQLTATADATSVFSSWTGACSGTNPVVTVSMTAAKNCVANFAAKKATLSVSKVGTGTVVSLPAGINCGTDCTEDYAPNTSVKLTATPPDATWVFSNWTGACSGTNPVVTVAMTAAKNCVAKFGPKVKPILVLEPVLPSKVCKGQPFEVTFAADSTKTVGEMQAWLKFTPTTSVSVVSATSLVKGAATLDFGSLGNVVFKALRKTTLAPPAIDVPTGKTNLFKVVFLAKDAGVLNLSFSDGNTWGKTINNVDGDIYEAGLPDPLTQTNLAAQVVVDSCL